MRMQASAVELLEVLLEETSELSNELAQEISQDLDVNIIKSFMENLWKLQQIYDEEESYRLSDETRHAIYRAFHVLRKMADYLAVRWKELTGNPSNGIKLIQVVFHC